MTTILLIRHASNDYLGRALAGRLPDVHLNEQGHREAQALAQWISRWPIQAIYCSPLERARETAQPLAEKLGIPVRIEEALIEVGFGDWTGMSMKELDRVADWRKHPTMRSCIRPPGGEHIIETQCRLVRVFEVIQKDYPEGLVAAVTHADHVRAALSFYLGVSVDLMSRIEVSPASVTVLHLDSSAPRVLAVNQTVQGLDFLS
jgi:broad specificity phosphatase PhoE